MRILVWVPSRPTEATDPIWQIVKWSQGLDSTLEIDPNHFAWPKRDHDVLLLGDVKSTSLSAARSAGIHLAKTTGVSHLVMPDSDNPPVGSIDKMMGYLNEASARGFGCIGSPAVSKSGTVGVLAPGGKSFDSLGLIPENLFEVDACTGGFLCIPKKCLDEMKPIGQFKFAQAKGAAPRLLPIYYEWSETTGESEDYALQRHIRDVTGFKIGADTRLKTGHFKGFYIPSWDRAEGEGQL